MASIMNVEQRKPSWWDKPSPMTYGLHKKKSWWQRSAKRVVSETKDLEEPEHVHNQYVNIREEEANRGKLVADLRAQDPGSRTKQGERTLTAEGEVDEQAIYAETEAGMALQRLEEMERWKSSGPRRVEDREEVEKKITLEKIRYVRAIREVRSIRHAVRSRHGVLPKRTSTVTAKLGAVLGVFQSAVRKPNAKSKAKAMDEMLTTRINNFSYYTDVKPQYQVLGFLGILRARAKANRVAPHASKSHAKISKAAGG